MLLPLHAAQEVHDSTLGQGLGEVREGRWRRVERPGNRRVHAAITDCRLTLTELRPHPLELLIADVPLVPGVEGERLR
eukprot:7023567-Pyramimonas_sp.AAC.1